jgi:hypothetical protein
MDRQSRSSRVTMLGWKDIPIALSQHFRINGVIYEYVRKSVDLYMKQKNDAYCWRNSQIT